MPTFNKKQLGYFRLLIKRGPFGNDLAKQILLHLFEHSDGLQQEVRFSLVEGTNFSEAEIRQAAYSLAQKLINLTLLSMDSTMRYSVHYGHIDEHGKLNTIGQLRGLPGPGEHDPASPLRYTFWLTKRHYLGGEDIPNDRDSITSISLR